MTRERPITFSGEMVQAILEGRKTQTRRVIKPQPASAVRLHQTPAGEVWYIYPPGPEHRENSVDSGNRYIRCPYGMRGDHLWVRETWFQENDSAVGQSIRYRADEPDTHLVWRPSLRMPRRAARILLEIQDIRIEQVHKISTDDCIAEGCPPFLHHGDPVSGEDPALLENQSPRERFQLLWDRLNAFRGHGWDTNPWVWVIEFERL